jgi:hypothetical protein
VVAQSRFRWKQEQAAIFVIVFDLSCLVRLALDTRADPHSGSDTSNGSRCDTTHLTCGYASQNLIAKPLVTSTWEKFRSGREHVGGRYRIRTYDFHRVKMALYR